ncbi:hypothetical protein BASA81_008032 [Batrachochytrium salamandrivorans]|nr:hypothetical protein BASA81_008032 [Batrachochytrium salamandrivorans]
MDEVLFFGDSLTWGMSHSYTGRYEESYPQMLEDRLASRGFYMVESALCSRTTNQNDAKFDWLVGGEAHFFNGYDHFMPEFLSHNCRALVLLLGTNDLKPHIRAQTKVPNKLYAAHVASQCALIAQQAKRAHSQLRRTHELAIVMVCPPTVKLCQHSIELGFDEHSVKISQDFPKAYAEMCQANGFRYVRVEGIDMEKSVDGVHVTLEDTRKIAEAVWSQALDDVLEHNAPTPLVMSTTTWPTLNEPNSEDQSVLRKLSWIQCVECRKWRMNEFGQSAAPLSTRRWTCRSSFWQHTAKEWKTGCGWNEDAYIVLANEHPEAVNVVLVSIPSSPPSLSQPSAPSPITVIHLDDSGPFAHQQPHLVQPTVYRPSAAPLSKRPITSTNNFASKPASSLQQHHSSAVAAVAAGKRHSQRQSAYPSQIIGQQQSWGAAERQSFRQFTDRLSSMFTPSFLQVWVSDVILVLNDHAAPLQQYHAFQNMKQLMSQYPQVVHDLDELVMTHPNLGMLPMQPPPPHMAPPPPQMMTWPPQQPQQAYNYAYPPTAPSQQPKMNTSGGFAPAYGAQSFQQQTSSAAAYGGYRQPGAYTGASPSFGAVSKPGAQPPPLPSSSSSAASAAAFGTKSGAHGTGGPKPPSSFASPPNPNYAGYPNPYVAPYPAFSLPPPSSGQYGQPPPPSYPPQYKRSF